MKHSIKISAALLVTAAFIAISAGELFAQRGDRPGMRGDRYEKSREFRGGPCFTGAQPGYNHMNRMQERLGLSDEQVDKIFKINTEYREKQFRNRNNPEETTRLREERIKEIDKILTDEQKENFRTGRPGYRRPGAGR